MAKPRTYKGTWWLPTGNEASRHEGTLTIDENNHCVLTLQGDLNGNSRFESVAVYWGQIKWDTPITLFGLTLQQWVVGSSVSFNVRYVIEGAHIQSLDEPFFDECHAEFPYFQKWTEASMMWVPQDEENKVFTIEYGKDHVYVQGDLGDGLTYKIADRTWCRQSTDVFSAQKETQYLIVSDKPLSIRAFNNQIREFAQFLSLAMFSKQQPSKIYYKRDGDDEAYKLVFVASPSVKPFDMPLIPLRKLVDRIPTFYANYHSVYDKISTLTKYLLTSLNVNEFDAPDFVIVAQALEGYYQRFLKGTEGIGNRKWEELIKRFDDIDAIKECNINADVLKDTRDVYSHLYIDDSPSVVTEINELIILTQKCKVLLTCCILEQIGMTHQEISECFDRSIVQYMVYNVKKYEEKKKQ